MTDRVKGFIVTLEKDIRIDDVEPLMNAIRMMRGIADVAPSVTDISDHMAQARVKSEIREKFLKFWKEIFD